MRVVPYNECMCNGCMVKYYNQGLIEEGTGAYEDVMEILKNKHTKVISGFPAIGKTVLTKESHSIVLDSDSSCFSWIEKGVRHPNFPNNYMEHIKKNLGKVDYILVSSHDIVRKALKENNIQYTLVYPSIELKEEYIQRYKDRGNDEGFIQFINSNWDSFITDIENEQFPFKVKLTKNQFLIDVLQDI